MAPAQLSPPLPTDQVAPSSASPPLPTDPVAPSSASPPLPTDPVAPSSASPPLPTDPVAPPPASSTGQFLLVNYTMSLILTLITQTDPFFSFVRVNNNETIEKKARVQGRSYLDTTKKEEESHHR